MDEKINEEISIENLKRLASSAFKNDKLLSFKEQIDNYAMQRTKSNEVLLLDASDSKYRHIPDLNNVIIIEQSKIKKICEIHKISLEQLSNLDSWLIYTPLVMESLSRQNSMVVFADAKDKDNNEILIALHLQKRAGQKGFEVDVDEITSVYGKENLEYLIENTVAADRKIFVNQNTKDWLRRAEVSFLECLTSLSIDNCSTYQTLQKSLNPEIERWLNNEKRNQSYLKTPDGKETIAVSDEVMFDALEREREKRVESKRIFVGRDINDPMLERSEILPEKKNNPRIENVKQESAKDILADCSCVCLEDKEPKFTSKEAEIEYRRSVMRSQILSPNESIAEAKKEASEFNKGLSDSKRHVMNQSSRKR